MRVVIGQISTIKMLGVALGIHRFTSRVYMPSRSSILTTTLHSIGVVSSSIP